MLTSIDPFVQEFDRLAQWAFGATDGRAARPVMPMDGVRSKDGVVLRFDLPGADPESIEVTVDRGVLTVSAQRTESYEEGETPFIRERATGSFSRRIHLADTIDTGKIEAAYTAGVLAVRMPLLEQAQPRKVEIHTDTAKKITA